MNPVDLSKIERLPPHSIEAEQGVLGSLLLSPQEAVPVIAERIGEGGAGFYDLRNRTLWVACLALFCAGAPIDMISVQQRLKDDNQLEAVGGLAYLASLPDAAPSGANLPYYLGIVVEKWRLRQLLGAAHGIIGQVHQHEGEVEALVRDSSGHLLSLLESHRDGAPPELKTLVQWSVADIARAYEHRNKGLQLGRSWMAADPARPTGDVSYLDKLTGGLVPGDVWFIGGEASVGKTSFMLTCALHQAGVRSLTREEREELMACQAEEQRPLRDELVARIKADQQARGVPVGFISAESSARSVVRRMLVNLAQANGMHVQTGHISEAEKGRLLSATVPLVAARLAVESPPALTPGDLRMMIRRLVMQHGIKVLFFDHLGELTDPELRGDQLRYVFKAGAEALRWAAREFGLTVIAAIHIKREAETELRNKSRRPVKTDLAESSFLERCADGIGVLYRDRSGEGEDSYDVANDGGEVWPVNLRVCKQREGPTGDAKFRFHRPQFRYEDAFLGAGAVDRGERRRATREAEGLPI